MTTGDKKALEALSKATSCVSICTRLNGRVVCFEQLVQLMSVSAGFNYVLERVVAATASDTSLRSVFGRGSQTREDDAMAGLDAYISDLRGKTGTLLMSTGATVKPEVDELRDDSDNGAKR